MAVQPMRTQRGYPEPGVTQFSVFLPNRIGKLRQLMSLFIKHHVHVVALDVVNAVDWAVVRVILSDAHRGRELLKDEGLQFTECIMLAVKLPSADSLTDLAGALLAAEVNLLVAYPLLVAAGECGVVAVQVDNRNIARQVLANHKFHLLDQSDLWGGDEPTPPYAT